MENNYRIHTNIISDTVLNVNMKQDYDFLEVLTLKLRQKDAYRLHSSNYGVIIGRVLANDAFGIPNVRISVFVEKDTNDPTYMETVYPYTEITSRDKDGRRYNLLPNDSNDDCYRIVGTFPSKRFVLDDNVQLEVFEKYYKFTTVTNNAGDYMLFGVPSGSQQIHVDMDLSDIGILSQSPTDFEYKGYNMTMFDSPTQFKESTNLDSLAQIFSQNKSVFVYPFWGDEELGNGIAAITRADIQIQYKFEPTCVFMGSIISDNEGNSIGHKCAPAEDNGMNSQLIAGEGTIEMIRKTPDGLIEEYPIQGNQLIDANGVWCYQIPMNLDFIGTDEYGNVVPTDNPNKGIPTRTQVRFRFSKNETGDEGFSRHTAKYLVPMNPTLLNTKPQTLESGKYIEKMYTFGSSTPEDCFRDLYWNNVYSVKNYIPKTQVAHRPHAPNYTGLKGSNLVDDQNPVPFNKLRIDLPFMYVIVCIIFNLIGIIVSFINMIINIINVILNIFEQIRSVSILGIEPFGWLPKLCCIGCISLGGGLSSDNTAFYPGCDNRSMDAADCPDDMPNCKKRASLSALMDLVQQKLAEDYKIVKLDFYQDWLNGSLYMPLWYWRKRKKKKFLFWTISGAKNEFCDCDKRHSRLKTYVTCSFWYNDLKLRLDSSNVPEGEDSWHRGRSQAERIFFQNGLIKGVENKDGLTAYYYVALNPTSEAIENANGKGIEDMEAGFYAIRLFATDIILLGNLKEDNLYGIPQFFKALPSTTANIPPIATIHDSNDDDGEDSNSKNTLADNGETSGPSMTTGMDWVYAGGPPKYKNGLFMDLACTYADTKAKSCINVERLSELGMNLDMQYDTTYASSTGMKVGTFETDGMITKYELDDIENRAMFATMNHVGFVPQTYQDKHSGFTTQVQDKNTTYLVPKFKYLYPTDLDGRMKVPIERYKANFKQVMSDDSDESYINFRLGDVQRYNFNTTDKNPIIKINKEIHEGKGQFYRYVNDNDVSMPLYNNSFYFYFGVKKGNTAIEKFNKMFYAQCFKNSKYPFSYDIEKQGLSYCPSAYSSTTSGNAISYISFTSDDIEKPYSYYLIDSLGRDKTPSGNTDIESDTIIISRNNENKYLENDSYILKIIDNNGNSLSERVTLNMPNISASVSTRNLGRKYYEDDTSMGDKICSNEFWGLIEINDILIDSYRFVITSTTVVYPSEPSGSIMVRIYGSNNNNMFSTSYEYIADLYLQVIDENGETTESINDYLCESSDTNKNPYYDEINKKLVFKVLKPSTFLITLKQRCNGLQISSNTSTQSVVVENGENFNTYLNGMPVKFMMDNFYPKTLDNWLKVHDPSIYTFPEVNDANSEIWEDYINIAGDINELYNKKNILLYKFSKIFDLSSVVYVTNNNGNNVFKYTATGGIQPTLFRSIAPVYNDLEKVENTVVYSDKNSVAINTVYPNIISSNYDDKAISSSESPRINRIYNNRIRENIGNYFAAFTNNGRYISDDSGNCETYSESIPSSAAVNVYKDYWKMLGEDEEYSYISELVYSGGTDEVCKKESKPYFKAMTVDRRLDCDLTILGALQQSDAWLDGHGIHYNDDSGSGRTIVDARVSGYFYNGIEMAYDENYNIIGQSASTELEYYYDIDNVSLTLNTNPNITKRYYSATLNGTNIIDAFWSLKHIATLPESGVDFRLANKTYYNNEANRAALGLNGFFDKDNYPTKRLIDIEHIKARGANLNLSVTPCSYSMGLNYEEPKKTTDNERSESIEMESTKLISTINQGETFEINLKFGGGIIPTPVTSRTLPKFGNQEVDYGHFTYGGDGDEKSINISQMFTASTYGEFSGETKIVEVGFMVDFKDWDGGDFDTYITVPKFVTLKQVIDIKSAPTIESANTIWDGIGKTFNNLAIKDEHNKNINDGYDVRETDGNPMILYKAKPLSLNGGLSNVFVGCCKHADFDDCEDVCWILNVNPNGDVELSDKDIKYGYVRQDYDSGIDYETFSSMTSGATEIALCYKRICTQNEKNNLPRRITSYEFTDFYYCGSITVNFEIQLNTDLTSDLGYRQAKISNFKAIKEDGSEMKGDVSINYVLRWHDLGDAATITWPLGVEINLDEVLGREDENDTFNFGEFFYIYLTTYDGIRYRFKFKWR